MPTRSQNAKLGLFLLVTALLLAFVLTVVSGFEFWEEQQPYHVISEDSVVGLEPGSPVTMRGVRVGEIEAIQLDPQDADSVRVQLAIDEGVPVPRNAKAVIQLGSLTGTKQVDIVDGDAKSGVLPPGSEIPLGESTLEALESRARELTDRAVVLLRRTDLLVANLVDLSEALEQGIDPKRLNGLVDRAESSLSSIEGAAEQLEAVVGEGGGEVSKVLEDVGQTSDELRDLLRHSNRILRANDDELRAAVRSFRDAARNLESLSRQLRRQPSSLLRSRPPKERELP